MAALMLTAVLLPMSVASAAAGGFSFSSTRTTVKPGETFTVSVHAASVHEYDRARSSLEYNDRRFRLVGIEGATGAFGREIFQGVTDPGAAYPYDCLTVERGSDAPATGSNLLVRLTYKVADSAPAGTYAIGQAPNEVCSSGLWKGEAQVAGPSSGRLQITVKPAADTSAGPARPTASEAERADRSSAGSTRNLFGFGTPGGDADESSSGGTYTPPSLKDLSGVGRTGSVVGSAVGAVIFGALVVGWLTSQGSARKR